MKSDIKKKFEKQGFLVVRNVLDFNFDLKPVLNDMEFIMNRLVHIFALNLLVVRKICFGQPIKEKVLK